MTSSRDDDPLFKEAKRVRRKSVRMPLGPQVFIKKGLSSFDPKDPYYFAITLGWRQFGLLFVGCELAINAVFAVLYCLQPGSIANQGYPRLLSAFFFSLETLATVGYGEMYPATPYAHVVSAVEILVGLLFTAIMTGLLFVRFSKPRAKVQYATRAVITPYNGVPTLMLRIGNARNSLLHDVGISLHALARTTSSEGLQHVAVVDLPLLRPRIPVFAILYTIMHSIDETSPLHGLTAAAPEVADLRFFLTLTARDPAVGQEVSDVHTFDGSNLCFGMRYVDAVRRVGEQQVVADYALLSEVEPIGAPSTQDSVEIDV